MSRTTSSRLARARVGWAIAGAMLAVSGDGALSTFSMSPGGASTSVVRITVAGLKSDAGRVRVAVFATAEVWLKKAQYTRVLEINGRQAAWLLEDVPYGEYAIAVYHDENANGRLDKNLVGMPSEPYGFSNNARRTFGAPTWEKARFPVASPSLEVAVSVK